MLINNINPILLDLYFIQIRWYGLFLGIGVFLGILVLTKLFKKRGLDPDQALSIGTWLTVGGLIGARIGHILFYNLDYYISNPIEIIMINHGGLSSHGMALGLIASFTIYTWRAKLDWRKLIDLLVIPIPLIAGFIRIGNFFNSEIVGRASDLPWAVQFPLFELNPISRHPSQIYEALIAFTIFGLLLWLHGRSKRADLMLTHLFILLYFSSRLLIEFTKEYHTLEAGLTMGQWLSLPFIIISIWLLIKTKSNR